jgi:pimeloyl-ACP methyl ester carboxylesterase
MNATDQVAVPASPSVETERNPPERTDQSEAASVAALPQEVRRFDGTTIPIWISGSGPLLLIVHGEASNHSGWESIRPYLDSRFTVVTMDRRATFGYPFCSLDMETEFNDVAAVANSLGDDVSIIGHSSGALCALGAAPLVPRLDHLILYEPPLETGSPCLASVNQLDAMLKLGDINGIFDTWLRQYVGMPDAAAEKFKASPAGTALRRYAAYLPREMAAHRAWKMHPDDYSEIEIPTTYIFGTETPVRSVQLLGMMEILANVMPDFRVRELPGEGHFANFTNPELLAQTIVEALVS